MDIAKLIKKVKAPEDVVVVSGLPRSGTSMMMKMLEAGGLLPMTDNERVADPDNPKGYYEFERVKKMPDGDTAWMKDAQGKAVKVISALLEHLPNDYHYRVVFMRRKTEEILASQRKMLLRKGQTAEGASDAVLMDLYAKHIAKVDAWLKTQKNMKVLYVDYNEMLQDPQPCIQRLNQFLDNRLDANSMRGIVDANLYRNRK